MDPHDVADHALLRDLPDGELEAVARVATPREFAAGERLTTQGDFGHCLFLVKTGTADVSIDGQLVRTVGPGDAVGEVAVLSSGRRTASVVATSPLHVLELFKRAVWALDREAPEAARRLRGALGEHTGSADDTVVTHDS
jgi:CRP-like cAMP-binding protein